MTLASSPMAEESKTAAVEEKNGAGGELVGGSEDETVVVVENGQVLNASGYRDELKRQYSLIGLAGIALTVDNAWVALGSSISVSIRKHRVAPNCLAAALDIVDFDNYLTEAMNSQWWSARLNLRPYCRGVLLFLHWPESGGGGRPSLYAISTSPSNTQI